MKYLKIIFKIICAKAYLFSTTLIPKKKNLWVFGSWKGRNYSDNSKELFEYICRMHKDIYAVWIAKNQEVFNEVSNAGFNVVLYPSLKSRWLVARASINVQTESNEDTGRFRVGGTKVIQLFHGYGGVKEPHLFAGMSLLKKFLVKIYADDHSKSYWMVPSKYFVKRCPIIYDTDPKKMFITGQARIDLLLSFKQNVYFDEFKEKYPSSKMILYMPTHRNYGQESDTHFKDDDWRLVNDYLINRNYFLFFKPHPLELEKYNSGFGQFSNIVLISQGAGLTDAYEYLHYYDMLISDYSSIITDFLVLDRPSIHFMYDLETFSTNNMIINPSNQFVCGPICKTWEETFKTVDELFCKDEYKAIRQQVRTVAFQYVDNNNCKRVYEQIKAILNGG